MDDLTDAAIVGGGIIGLAIAAALASEGQRVVVLDASAAGQASHAAAGMLAPLAETAEPGPLLDLRLQSLALYPAWTDNLASATSARCRLPGKGLMRIALTDEDEDAFAQSYEWQRGLGLELIPLSASEARKLEPALSPNIRSAILSPKEDFLDPRVLMTTLRRRCEQLGVKLFDDLVINGFGYNGRTVASVISSRGAVQAEQFVIAAGAWSAEIAEWLGSVPVRVFPCRGQMFALSGELPQPIHRALFTHGTYLVPRPDGRVILGATMEPEAGFAIGNTPDAEARLRAGARLIAPELADRPLESSWSGLRPMSPDGLPILGRIPGLTNVAVATGHGRNGVLLAPITAQILSDLLLHGTAPPEAFDPSRLAEVA